MTAQQPDSQPSGSVNPSAQADGHLSAPAAAADADPGALASGALTSAALPTGSAAYVSGSILRAWMEVAGAALAENVDQINDLNVFPVPDADTGTNSNATFQAALQAVAQLPADADAATIARAMGRAAALGARGNSGVILSQMLRGVSEAAIDPERPFSAVALARVLDAAAANGREAVADPRDGTMLSVMSDAARAAGEAVSSGDLVTVAIAAADAARQSLEDTPNHLEVLAAAGVVDAGGRTIVVVLDALVEVLTGVPRPAWHAPVLTRSCDIHAVEAHYDGPAYEVMFVLRADAPGVADVRAQLVSLGDSLAVVGGDGIWNVHVHVDDPAAAVDIGRAAGVVESTRISYLRSGFNRESTADSIRLVAVLPASQLGSQLTEAGVTIVGEGELAQLVTSASDDLVVCVPRNFDFKDASNRVAQIVCPTPAHIIAAAGVWDSSQAFDEAVNQVAAAVSNVTTALVVADGGEFVVSAGTSPGTRRRDIADAVVAAVEALRGDQHELVTVVLGPGDAELLPAIADAVSAAVEMEVETAICPLPAAARVVVGLE